MKWEYKKTEILDETAMTEIGKLGWELVSVIGYRGSTSTMFFKRQIKED